MQNYSKGEKEAMIAAFAHHFNVSKEVASAPAAWEWIADSPVVIVDYDGYLKGENAADRDKRMEIVSAYDGQVSELVSYLRYKFPNRKSLTKWALIFQVHADIIDVNPTIERAKSQIVLGASEESDETPIETEVAQSNPGTSTKELLGAETEAPAVEQPAIGADTVHMAEAEATVEEPSDNHGDVQKAQVADDSDATPSGNGHEPVDTHLYKTTNHMEEEEMSGVNDLLQAAQGAQGSANPAETQQAPSANTGAVKADMKVAQMAVSQRLSGEAAARNEFTRNNVVTALVTTQKPAAMRRISDKGTVGTETDPVKQADAINGKLIGFIAAVTGKKGLTVEQFEALTDAERYANVVTGTTKVNDVDVSNVDKAKAIYELIKAVKQNPAMEVPAFIPAKLSYPIKGYAVAGKPMPADEFMVLMCDKSNGGIYGEGGVNEAGAEVDGATSFRLATAKKVERAQATAITTQKVERRVPVVRIKNKAAFIEGGKHLIYLFEQEDTENEGRAAFRAAINVNGVMVSAGVTVYALDDAGQRQVISHNDKDNTDRYKTKQASVSVSVPVKKMLKEFGAEFKGNDDTIVAAGRWGVPMGISKAANGDFCNIKEFSQAPVFDVFTQVYAGKVSLSGKLKESATLQGLRAAADQAAAEEAAEAADSLA